MAKNGMLELFNLKEKYSERKFSDEVSLLDNIDIILDYTNTFIKAYYDGSKKIDENVRVLEFMRKCNSEVSFKEDLYSKRLVAPNYNKLLLKEKSNLITYYTPPYNNNIVGTTLTDFFRPPQYKIHKMVFDDINDGNNHFVFLYLHEYFDELKAKIDNLIPALNAILKGASDAYKLAYIETEIIESNNELKTQIDTIPESKDNILHSIELYLFPFEDDIGKDYKKLVSAIHYYFKTNHFPVNEPIIFKRKVAVKRFGWACNKIFSDQGKSVPYEMLKYAKDYISIYENVNLDEPYTKSNLYNYFTINYK